VRMPTTSFFSIFCACIASSCYFCYFNLKKSILHGFFTAFSKKAVPKTPLFLKVVPKTPLFKKKRYQKHVEKWYQKHVENTYKKLLILKGVIPL